MSKIKVRVTDQVMEVTDYPVIASGGIEEDQIDFMFSEDWAGFMKTVVFYRLSDRKSFPVYMGGGTTVTVPMEAIADDWDFVFGVLGTKGDVTRTSEVMTFRVVKGADTEIFPSTTVDIYGQVIEELRIASYDANRRPSRINAAQIADVAKSYYRNRGDAEHGYSFVYGHNTCVDEGFDPATGREIDCSALIGLVLRGIPFYKSPYTGVIAAAGDPTTDEDDTEADETGGSTETDAPDGYSPRSLLANTADYQWAINPFDWENKLVNLVKPVRTASQLGQWMKERGWAISYDETFHDVEIGDVIFYAKKNSAGEWVQPNRYMHISHVSIVISKIYVADYDAMSSYNNGKYCYHDGLQRCLEDNVTGAWNASKWQYIGPSHYRHGMIEATTGNSVILNRTLERTYANRIVLICRPDLGAVTDGEFTGNIVSEISVSNVDNLYRDGLYYLTSGITAGIPLNDDDEKLNRNTGSLYNTGAGYAIRVETTYRKNGQPYSIVQKIVDTRHDNEVFYRAKYLYTADGYLRPDDPAAHWTSWNLIINKGILDLVMEANGLGTLTLDSSGNWTVVGGGGIADPTAVRFISQVLTDVQKSVARSNIGAVDSDTVNSLISAAINAIGLKTVATSGAYNDLSGRPDLKTVATSGAYADLSGRPDLKPVATSGAYNDLSGLPVRFAGQTKIPANSNLDDPQWWVPGSYYIANGTDAGTITNCPLSLGGVMFVIALGDGSSVYRRQIIIQRTSDLNFMQRYNNNGSISSWYTLTPHVHGA